MLDKIDPRIKGTLMIIGIVLVTVILGYFLVYAVLFVIFALSF